MRVVLVAAAAAAVVVVIIIIIIIIVIVIVVVLLLLFLLSCSDVKQLISQVFPSFCDNETIHIGSWFLNNLSTYESIICSVISVSVVTLQGSKYSYFVSTSSLNKFFKFVFSINF